MNSQSIHLLKTTLLIISFFCFFETIQAQNKSLKAELDERIELMSVVSHISGIEGYQSIQLRNYDKEIDKYFKPYLKDSLILYTKELNKETEIAYDAMMTMAVHLQIKNNQVEWKENIVSNSLSDVRWKDKSEKYVRLLSKFYQTSKFHQFYQQHQPMYEKTIALYDTLFNDLDLAWFSNFIGLSVPNQYHFVIGFSIEGGGYGSHVTYKNGVNDIYSIVSISTDKNGNPIADKWVSEATVHEFFHFYCNPLIDQNYALMEKSMNLVKELTKDSLLPTFYSDPQIIGYETFVRACTILYFIEHNMPEEEVAKRILQDQALGFVLEPLFVKALKQYQLSRDRYKTLADFMPALSEQINAGNPKMLYDEVMAKFPRITSISIINGDKNVDPALQELKIIFDQPMLDWINGWEVRVGGLINKVNLPEITEYTWDKKSQKELVIHFKLKPYKNYLFKFHKQTQAKNGLYSREVFDLKFKTRRR
jgi:hypothetical protein